MGQMAICSNAQHLEWIENKLVEAEDALDRAMCYVDFIREKDGRCPAFVEHDIFRIKEEIQNMRADVAFYKEAYKYRYNVEHAGDENEDGGWF